MAGLYADRVIILRSDGESSVFSGRFSLKDNPQTRSFTVTISDLKMDDAGPYGCGAGWGPRLDIQLNRHIHSHWCFSLSATHHTETETTTGNTSVQLHQPNTTSPSDLASVAGGLGSVLLVLTLCSGTFIILKKRKRKYGTALFQQNMQHNTETGRIYEEIPNSDVTTVTSSSNQTPASSSNQTPASHLNNCTNVSIIYATVTNQQPDSNPSHTHSTNQATDTADDYYGNIKCPEATQDSGTELIYVTATHPQNITTHPQNVTTHEGPIYSVINRK
ncbi:uncharacterized protein LOC130105917 [Rhinichthys klamathensis goyatoka]|uniref:uncharacterized protein LOC130105917 n=1 Tax=Rhinichthys klamathensis goyatoka TaxID=3034132 RepID=UPI0024B561AF|nr:uncharacterized protein LOC130105917 [Rhinichthys klamathensis goyatoka]